MKNYVVEVVVQDYPNALRRNELHYVRAANAEDAEAEAVIASSQTIPFRVVVRHVDLIDTREMEDPEYQ